MPLIDNEYSTPKITPADGVKIPSVDGNSGYQLDSDLRHYIGDGIMGESDEFSTLLTYTVGSFCIHVGVLYQCAIPITSPGQWDASKWNKIDLKTLNDLIGVVGGGVIPKGDILSTNLPTPSASNKGWQYYCTDLAKNAVSDGTQWVYFSNTMLTDTPDETDTSHALTNAAATQQHNNLKTAFESLGLSVIDGKVAQTITIS